MTATSGCLVVRLAGPLQSWGGPSQFNRRDTLAEPTKSGIIGLLAAAQGRRRRDTIEDLLGLTLGVRTDRAGTVLRDYHTVSTLDGTPLPAAQVNGKGAQKRTSPPKYTHVTTRFYLQDAVFVTAVAGPGELLAALAAALRQPAFPLALGRRSCPVTQPLLVTPDSATELWPDAPLDTLARVPWQGGTGPGPARLPVTVDDLHGDDLRSDVPTTFDPLRRGYTTRPVSHHWVTPPGCGPAAEGDHDPFALLGE